MRIPPAGKTIPAAQPLQMFRVTADWVGGGFAYTLSFPDAIAARAWGMQKARGRGQVSVEPRGLAIGAAGALHPFREDDFLPTALLAGDVDLDAARCVGAL